APLRGSKARPGGRLPSSCQPVVPEPPVATGFRAAIGMPTSDGGTVGACAASGSRTGTLNCLLARRQPSPTPALERQKAAVVGAPLIVPLDGFSVSPGGSCPVAVDHVRVPLPPCALKASVYGAPTVAGGAELVVMASAATMLTVNARWDFLGTHHGSDGGSS